MKNSVRRLPAVALSVVLAVTAMLPTGSGPAAAASGDKRPNLQMLQLRDWRIQTIDGRRLLRFTTIFVNAGPGRFELRGGRSSRSDPTMDIDQVMYRWDGTARRIDTPARAKYSGDGHDHWHVQDVVVYEAWNESDRALMRRGAKTGFCFFDTTAWNLALRGARQSPYYQEEWCGTRSSMTNRVGVSVGWGDNYPWNFAYQWIDITGLPGGTYRVRATVDIQDYYDETAETDNCVWARVRLPAPGSTRGPSVISNGADCGVAAMTAVSSFADGEAWDPPRAVSVEPGRRIGYQMNSQGTVLRKKQWTPSVEHIVSASARATPPGHTRRLLYITSGPLAGYWLHQGDGVRIAH